MRKGPMPIDRHDKNANDLSAAAHYLTKIINRCEKHYPKTSNIMKLLKTLSPLEEGGSFEKLQGALGKQFRKDMNTSEDIYKNLPERFKKAMRNPNKRKIED